MGTDVRTITEDEVPAWCAALNLGFLNPAGAVDAEARRPGLDLDRTWAAVDGGRVVATLRSFGAEVTVPGGVLPACAVTAVTTTATHRRQGLASRMVAGELAAAVDRGEPMSVLIAAEWGIYGRFGYGPATEHQTVTVDTQVARLRVRPQGTIEHVDRETARALAPAVYEPHRLGRPGEISRTARFWDIDFGLLRFPSWPEPKPGFFVVARDPSGTATGLARYRYEENWQQRQPRGRVVVQQLLAAGPEAEALLWHHLITLDMVATLRAEDRPVDELLPWLLTDARHAQASERADFVWVRPLDVPAMLAGRSYPAPGRLVLEVVDPGGPVAGRYALEAGPDGARCVRTAAPADVTLDAAALGTVFLGGYGFRTLAAAGLVDEHTAGAVARGDQMFRSPVAPWCGTWF